ncbi:integrin alpha-9-like [Manacus vitellinus]|uniref:integrin alpha-9-like n=1 Tax=Manacus vitellinus TaxID=328815 RepID=UPI00084792B7|nr:integrin alpha-9-like [Manacus vitellinus]
MREKLFQMTQVDPGHMHTLCLGSSCVYWDGDDGWVLVGAPKAESKYSTSVQSPGAVFKCRVHTNPDRRCTELDMGRGNSRGTPCGKTCKEDRDDEWMGVSLARQPKAGGSVLACAHRWKNIYYETEYILPHGFCNIIPPNLQSNGRQLLPCYEDFRRQCLLGQEQLTKLDE